MPTADPPHAGIPATGGRSGFWPYRDDDPMTEPGNAAAGLADMARILAAVPRGRVAARLLPPYSVLPNRARASSIIIWTSIPLLCQPRDIHSVNSASTSFARGIG